MHYSVLLNESIENLNIKEDGIYVDATLGYAGHSKEILKRLKRGFLFAFDADSEAISYSHQLLSEISCNFKIFHSNFVHMKERLAEEGITEVDGILFDLGFSSPQVDNPTRGFSFMHDAPLDMRMDREAPFSAYDVVNDYSEEELHRVIKEYGEEKWAKRIANFIVKAREDKKIKTPFELVDIIKRAIPAKARREGPHPAKRTFQAIRIEVNGELRIIEQTILDGVDKLNIGGRMDIITFHSLEDRIVKNTYKKLEHPCTCPKEFPVCICHKVPKVKILTRKPMEATEEELEFNPRSRSAKLRIVEKI